MVHRQQSPKAVHWDRGVQRWSGVQCPACQAAERTQPRPSRGGGAVPRKSLENSGATDLLPRLALAARQPERGHAGIPAFGQGQDQVHATLKDAPPANAGRARELGARPPELVAAEEAPKRHQSPPLGHRQIPDSRSHQAVEGWRSVRPGRCTSIGKPPEQPARCADDLRHSDHRARAASPIRAGRPPRHERQARPPVENRQRNRDQQADTLAVRGLQLLT